MLKKYKFPKGFKIKTLGKLPTFQIPKTKLKLHQLRLLTHIATGFMILVGVGLLFVILVFAFFARQLPNPDTLLERSYELSTKLYDRNGELIYEVFGEKNRTLVKLEDIAPQVADATLAVEDSGFYQHQGFSFIGMLRAVKNMLLGQSLQSGSTLTQQVIKNTLLSQDQTLTRKIKELILSLQLEQAYSKNEILQMYLNETPYGGQNYGVYSAAKAYFNKDPRDLSIAESAYIAGLPQSPSVYSPYSQNPDLGLARKDYVLYLMNVRGWLEEDGKRHYLNEEEYNKAKEEELVFDAAKVAFKAPHFIFYVKDLLVKLYGEDVMEQGGLKVTTSLDLKTQEMAETILNEEVTKAEKENVWNGSMVVLDSKTSQILAMVGSKDYNGDSAPEGCLSGQAGEGGCKFDPYVNVATSSRQPGSAIKPITYATMLAQGYPASFPFLDVQTVFPGSSPDKPYIPVNYDGTFRGPMSMRKSLGNSLNIPAVKALSIVGIDNMISMAEKMGIHTFTDRQRYGLALTLGGGETKLLELTTAYNVFASEGIHRETSPFIEIKDSNDTPLYKWNDSGQQVLSKEVAFLIWDMLSDDGARSEAFGAGSLLNIKGHRVAVKTGTTDDKRDNYAMGFTPQITVGVWVGNSNNDKMNPYIASGISGATPIYSRFFTEYLTAHNITIEDEKVKPSDNLEKVEIDSLSGMLPVKEFPTRQEWFIKGTKPTTQSTWYKNLEVCDTDRNLANDSCRDDGNTDTDLFVKVEAERPEWQTGVDAWIKEHYNDDERYFPPSIETILKFKDGDVENKDEVYAKIVGVRDGGTVPLLFRLNVEVSAYEDIDKVTIYMDDNKITEDSGKPFGYNFELTSNDVGKHKFRVVATDENDNKDEDEVELNVVGYSLYEN